MSIKNKFIKPPSKLRLVGSADSQEKPADNPVTYFSFQNSTDIPNTEADNIVAD